MQNQVTGLSAMLPYSSVSLPSSNFLERIFADWQPEATDLAEPAPAASDHFFPGSDFAGIQIRFREGAIHINGFEGCVDDKLC